MVKPAPRSQGCLGRGAPAELYRRKKKGSLTVGCLHQTQRSHARMLEAFSPSNQATWLGKGPKIITQRQREPRQVIILEKYRGLSK